MKRQMKCPGSALERTPGANEEFDMRTNSLTQTYASSGILQTRHVRNRCGLTDNRAQLIASLLFGEGGN
jgi:hypothetical protein